jgi:hypothetical protein
VHNKNLNFETEEQTCGRGGISLCRLIPVTAAVFPHPPEGRDRTTALLEDLECQTRSMRGDCQHLVKVAHG